MSSDISPPRRERSGRRAGERCSPAIRGNRGRSSTTIETALFCVVPGGRRIPRTRRTRATHLLHGDSGNRWFDKAVSLIVFADGTGGDQRGALRAGRYDDPQFRRHAARRHRRSKPFGESAYQPKAAGYQGRRVRARRVAAGRRAGAPRIHSPCTGPNTPRPLCCPSTASAPTGPSSYGFRRMHSSRWRTSSLINAPKGLSARPTNRSRPGSTGAGAQRRCASSHRRSCDSSPQWMTLVTRPAAAVSVSRSGGKARRTCERMPGGTGPRTAPVGAAGDRSAPRRGAGRRPSRSPCMRRLAGSRCATTT